jgi:chromate transporter
MTQAAQLFSLAWHFVVLSIFAVGGGISMLVPVMHQEVVLQYHWLDERAFAESLAVAQSAPGPNFLLVPIIGFHVAALPGAIVSLLAFLVIPVTIAFFVGRVLHDHDNAFMARFRTAFRPVTGGLWIASGAVIAASVDHTVVPLAITIAVAALSIFVDIAPIYWCLAAGLIGYLLA